MYMAVRHHEHTHRSSQMRPPPPLPALEVGSRLVFVPSVQRVPAMELSRRARERFVTIVSREPVLQSVQPNVPGLTALGTFAAPNTSYEWFGDCIGGRVGGDRMLIWRAPEIDLMRQTMADAGWDLSEEAYRACLRTLEVE